MATLWNRGRPHTLFAFRPPRFVVAQTGHSASGYTSRVFTQAGIRTGHEDWFRPYRRRVRGLVGDSSWCAVAELERYRGIVFHQVRDPLRVLRSLSMDVFDEFGNGRYARLRWRLMGGSAGDQVVDAMWCWIVFNQTTERHAVMRWRVEDLDLTVLRDVAAVAGVPLDLEVARAAVDATPRDVNRHHEHGAWTWADLPDGPLRERIMSMSAAYGYPVP